MMVVIGSVVVVVVVVVVVSQGGVIDDGVEGKVNGRAAMNLRWGRSKMGAWWRCDLEWWRCYD